MGRTLPIGVGSVRIRGGPKGGGPLGGALRRGSVRIRSRSASSVKPFPPKGGKRAPSVTIRARAPPS